VLIIYSCLKLPTVRKGQLSSNKTNVTYSWKDEANVKAGAGGPTVVRSGECYSRRRRTSCCYINRLLWPGEEDWLLSEKTKCYVELEEEEEDQLSSDNANFTAG
jgi:hypothetical protein